MDTHFLIYILHELVTQLRQKAMEENVPEETYLREAFERSKKMTLKRYVKEQPPDLTNSEKLAKKIGLE